MNNLLSYCRLIDAKIRASEKDLPVIGLIKGINSFDMKSYYFATLLWYVWTMNALTMYQRILSKETP